MPCDPENLRNIQEKCQAQIDDFLRNVEPAEQNVILKKKRVIEFRPGER